MLVMWKFKERITLEFRNFIYSRRVMNISNTTMCTAAASEHRFDSHSYLCVGKYTELMTVGILFWLSGSEHDTDR